MSNTNRQYVPPLSFSERPWDHWVNEIGHSSPEEEPEVELKRPSGLRRKISRLKWDSYSIHGFFPQSDNLNAAVCYMCGAVVKLCAAQSHLEEYHPELPPPSTVPRLSQSRARQRREAIPSSSIVVPPPLLISAPEPPVVSIRDPTSPLVDVADDIFEIMNSEGIRSADDLPNADWRSIVRDIEGTLVTETPPPPPPPKQTKSRPRPKDYDPDRHCGVLTADARPCVRSLTCKAHPISMRRSVEGRSKPFDQLLADKRAAAAAMVAAANSATCMLPPPPLQLPPPAPIPKVSPPIQLMQSPIPQPIDQSYTQLASLPTFTVPEELLADTPAELLKQADDLYGAFLAAQEVIPPEVVDLVSAPENCLQPGPIVTHIDSMLPILETPIRPPRLSTPEEEKSPPSFSPAAVWWYGTSPRPLAVCTFGATTAGGSVLLGRRYAKVRADFKASLSRGVIKSAGPTAKARNKSATPEIRRLVVARLNGQLSSKGRCGSFSLDPLLEDKC